MIDLLKRVALTFHLLAHSFTIYINDIQLILLSLIHAISLYIAINGLLFSFSYLYFQKSAQEQTFAHLSFTPILIIIICWLMLYFTYRIINLYFSVAIARSYLQKLKNNPESIFQSLKRTLSKITIIIEWATTWSYFSLYASSKPIEKPSSAYSGDLQTPLLALKNILGFAWETTNLLVAPIIAEEPIKITTIAKHENEYLKEAFGEKINVRFNFKVITFLSILALILYYLLAPKNIQLPEATGTTVLKLGLFLLFYSMCLIQDLKTIYQSLVYAYIKDIPTKSKTLIEKSLVGLKN